MTKEVAPPPQKKSLFERKKKNQDDPRYIKDIMFETEGRNLYFRKLLK